VSATRKAVERVEVKTAAARDYAAAAEKRAGDIVDMLSTMSAADAAVLRTLSLRLEAQDHALAELQAQVSGLGGLLTDVSERIGRAQAPKKAVAKKTVAKKTTAPKKAPAKKR
jgi:septal ring factor EnvC (AmiA/AmiB activator)